MDITYKLFEKRDKSRAMKNNRHKTADSSKTRRLYDQVSVDKLLRKVFII